MSARNSKSQVKITRHRTGKLNNIESESDNYYSSSGEEEIANIKSISNLNIQTKPSIKLKDVQKPSSDSDSEDEDIRESIKMNAKITQLSKKPGEDSSEVAGSETQDDSSGSEEVSETDSENAKPVFVPKPKRLTIMEKEAKEELRLEYQMKRQKEKEQRRLDSFSLVQAKIREELKEKDPKDVFDVDDTDDLSSKEEYEKWKIRELLRIKRDKEETEKLLQEQELMEKRRAMTEEEKLKEDLIHSTKLAEERENNRSKPVFMQKYYHKGAFYLDSEEDIYKRDYMQPTQDEVKHKELLPTVLQTRDFGKASKSKYTHLVDQDTSRDSPWEESYRMKKRIKENESKEKQQIKQ